LGFFLIIRLHRIRSRPFRRNPNGIPIIQPSVDAQRLRWVNVTPISSTLKVLNRTIVSIDSTLSELLIRRSISQGSSFLATLGWMTQTRWVW
jgi:hypothetical protein